MAKWEKTTRIGVEVTAGHSYGADDNGLEIPSVTRLIMPNSTMPKVATHAMKRGTRIHEVLEEVVKVRAAGESIRRFLCGSEDIQADVYELAMQWQSKVHVPYAKASSEVSFVCQLDNGQSSYSYAGTIDLVECLNGKVVMCADWKSGSAYAWHKLQLACYMHAIDCPSGAIIYRDKVVWVDPMSSAAVVALIQSYHEKQAELEDKKKVKITKYKDWVIRCRVS